MGNTPTNTIPEGLATKLGKYGAVLFAVLAVLAELFEVELDTETMAGFAGSLVLLITTMLGRYKQATEKIKSEAANVAVEKPVVVNVESEGPMPDKEEVLPDTEEDFGALGDDDEPYFVEDFETKHERFDIHDAEEKEEF